MIGGMSTATIILGTTDEVTTCDCCLREDLTKTVALSIDGETMFLGVICAARKMGEGAATVRKMAKAADAEKAEAARRARQQASAMEFDRQQQKLDAMFPHIAGQQNRLQQVRLLFAQGVSLASL
jgi:hypothetical protein